MKKKREMKREGWNGPNGISFVVSFSFRGGGRKRQTEREREREGDVPGSNHCDSTAYCVGFSALGLVGMHFPRRGSGGSFP